MDKNTQLASIVIGGRYYPLMEGTVVLDGVECAVELENPSEGLYSWLVRVKNVTDGKSPRIQKLLGFDFSVPVSGSAEFHTLRGDDCTSNSFMPEDFSLENGERIVRKPTGGRSSNTTAFPYFDVVDEEGKGFVAGIGWSGQWLLTVEREQDTVWLRCGQEDCDFILEPQEAVRSVRALIYLGEGGTDALRHAFVRKSRKHYSPIPEYSEAVFFPSASQCFDLYYWGGKPEGDEVLYFETEQAQHDICESAGKCSHINSHWIDACWFDGAFRTGVGNFSYAKGFPKGLRPVADDAHSRGMRLIVWFETIRAHPGTEVYNRFHHDPTKIISIPNTTGWDTGRMMVNIGDEEVWQYQFDRISQVIEESGIDIYRQDFNINPLEYLRSIEGPDRKGIAQIRVVEGMYRLWDALRERFPGLIIDNCSSGGRLLDVETNMRSYPLLQSDMCCRAFPIAMQNENLALSRYMPYHQCVSSDESAYFMRSSVTTGVSCQFEYLHHILGSEIVLKSLQAICEKEKDRPEQPETRPNFGKFTWKQAEEALADALRLKEYWGRGDFTALTEPSLRRDVYAAYTLRIPEEDRGVIVVFRRPDAPESFVACVPEVERDSVYQLTLVGEQREELSRTVFGAQLADGFRVTIPQAPGSTMLFYRPVLC